MTATMIIIVVAAIATTIACLTFRQKKKFNRRLVGTAIILVGSYFVIYDIVSVWVPIYHVFLPLTDFWMVTLPILGIAILLNDDY